MRLPVDSATGVLLGFGALHTSLSGPGFAAAPTKSGLGFMVSSPRRAVPSSTPVDATCGATSGFMGARVLPTTGVEFRDSAAHTRTYACLVPRRAEPPTPNHAASLAPDCATAAGTAASVVAGRRRVGRRTNAAYMSE